MNAIRSLQVSVSRQRGGAIGVVITLLLVLGLLALGGEHDALVGALENLDVQFLLQ